MLPVDMEMIESTTENILFSICPGIFMLNFGERVLIIA